MANPSRVTKCGPVRVSHWPNTRVVDGEMVEILSFTLNRAYKEEDNWKYSKSFNVEDLPKIALAALEIYKSLRLESKDVPYDVNSELPENSDCEDFEEINEDI